MTKSKGRTKTKKNKKILLLVMGLISAVYFVLKEKDYMIVSNEVWKS